MTEEFTLCNALLAHGSARSILLVLDDGRSVTLPDRLLRYDRDGARCGEKITLAMPLWLARKEGLL
ncbi:hypothetical protein JCM15519_38530 [Fundidesulfovibrio butyratiphilus]